MTNFSTVWQHAISRTGLVLSAGLILVATSPTHAQLDGYMNNDALVQSIETIAKSNVRAQFTQIGTSRDGSPIHVITLAADPDHASNQPALLITAGIDGRHLVGTEAAIRMARQILEKHQEVLDSMTIYIIPRVNPDASALNLQSLTMGTIGNSNPIDDDRDRSTDEDGPDDLNGDGYITIMRRLNPSINDHATHLADPDDPRLNIEPDPKEGSQATFTIYPEGLDNDLDGQINEDGKGYVDLNQNFMHRWPEYETHSGAYPLSEPESHAIARFVFDHPNIVMAVTFGPHDNLINSPDSKSKDISNRAPKSIDSKDADLYSKVSELYKEATGQKEAPKSDDAGSFHAWLYAQRGIPSFASTVWNRPEIEKKSDDASDESSDKGDEASTDKQSEPDTSGLTPSGVGDISQETIDELMVAYEAMTGEPVDESMKSQVTPEMIEGFAAQAGIVVRRITIQEPEAETKSEKKPKGKKQSDDAKWLEYFDSAGIQGFVDWTPFEHSTLGPVEIGGFLPLAKLNPPSDQLDDAAQKQTDFVLKLLDMKPQVNVVGPEIKELASGLYEVRFAIENTGVMATSTAFSQSSRTMLPMIVRISSSVDNLVSGQRTTSVWGIDGNGGRSEHHWILRSNIIQSETIEIVDPRFGNRTIKLDH